MRTKLRRAVTALVFTSALIVAGSTPALAYAPVDIVHTEHVKAGPYNITIGFSTWPIRAMRSLDFTFVPTGGIAGKSGQLLMDGPGVKSDEHVTPLVRHPRKLDSWGLDVHSLDVAGDYSIGFAVDGPQGHGEGKFTGLVVQSQPGPPLALSWVVGSLPLVVLVVFLVLAWRRLEPGRLALRV